MKGFSILSCVAVVLFSFPAYAADEPTYDRVLKTGELRCGYINWNPYYIADPNNPEKRSGVNVEITQAVGKILGLKIIWAEETGWGTFAEGLRAGRFDALCTSVWPDAAKIKNLSLSDPMFYDTLYPYVRADEARFKDKDSLDKPEVKVAAIEGGPSYEIAQNAFPHATLVGIAPNVPTADFFLTVATKKADVLITSPSEFQAFADNNPGKLKRLEKSKPVRVMPMLMSFGPDNDALRNRVNFALQMMIDNGDMDRIVQKYSKDYVLRTPAHDLK